jgi:hypothetical protein
MHEREKIWMEETIWKIEWCLMVGASERVNERTCSIEGGGGNFLTR